MRPSKPDYVPAHYRYQPPPFNGAQEAGPGAWWWIRLVLTIAAAAVLIIAFGLVMSSVMGPVDRSQYVEPSPYGPPPVGGPR
jgi:hypothetical protein